MKRIWKLPQKTKECTYGQDSQNNKRERVEELCRKIQPVISFGKERYYIKKVDPEKIAFTWDPKKTKRARKLKPLKDITTYHTYGYYGMFKPSIAEVLAQIPEELLAATRAFEIVERPET